MRILVVDDHELVRKGICSVLASDSTLTVCGEAVDGQDAVEKAKASRPDLVVMDISMPKMNGLEATREIKRMLPETEIVIVSQHQASEMFRQAFNAGARGYVAKSSVTSDLLAAIKTVQRHETFVKGVELDNTKHNLDAQEILQRSATFEKALRESEERFRSAMNNMAEGLYTIDTQGLVTYLNPSAEEMFGWTLAELTGKKMHDVTHYMHPDGTPFPAADCPGLQVLQKGIELREHEDVFIRKDGTLFPVVFSASPLKNIDAIQGVVVCFRDDTQHRQAAKALQRKAASEERLRLAQQVARVGTFEWNIKTGVNQWTPELEAMYGLPAGGFPGTQPAWEQLVHPDDREETVRRVENAMKEGVFEGEWRVVWPDKSVHWILGRASVLKDKAGNPELLVGVNIEVTERKRIETAMQENEARFREMIDALPAAIYTTDAEGRLTHFNQAAIEFSGRVPQLGTDRWCVNWKLFWPDGTPLPLEECPMAIALREGRILDGVEVIAERPDGTRVWFTPYPRPFHDAAGRVIGGINMMVDITERKQSERANSLLAAIVDSSDDAIISKGLDGIITSWNKAAERIFGYTAEEAVGKHITLIIPADRRYEEVTIIERLKRGERIEHFETRRMRKDGTQLDISLTISPVKDKAGRVVGASKVAREITERKHAERANGLLAAIVDSSDDAIISKSLDGVITSWNKAAERLFGYPAKEAVGQHITLIVPKDRRDEEMRILEQLRRGERIEHFETCRARKDGTLVDISLTISPVKNAAGRVVGASKVARDISGRKQAEERERRITAEAVAATAKFRAVFEQTTVFAGIMTLDGIIVDANRLCLDACGYRAEDVLGKPFWECGWWKTFPESRDKIRAATPQVANGTPYREILHYSWADGTERLVDFALYPIRDEQGHILFLHPTGVDITDLKRAEENYRALAETLDAEVRARTSEVVQQSEQLRELSNRLLRTQDDERRHIARELHDSAGQIITALGMNLAAMTQHAARNPALGKAVEDSQNLVQQLSKEIRTTSYLLHPPLLDENGLPEAIRWYTQGLTERSGLTIELDMSEDFGRLPGEMELAVFRIVQECLTNIHRHSGSQIATVRLSRGEGSVVVEIQDQGKGIPAEKLEGIHAQRSGVGITGMRERVRHFKGTMNIHSKGEGTKISVTLPVTPTAIAEPERILQEQGSGTTG